MYAMRTTNTLIAAASVRSLIFLGVLTLASCYRDQNGREVFRLQILHTNDMHSHFNQYDKAGMFCLENDSNCYGGFPRIKSAVRQEFKKAGRNSNVDATVFLNGGDTFQGTAFYSVFKWEIVADLLPELGIDVMSFGNHEFDGGVDDLEKFLEKINVPVVAANVDFTKLPKISSKAILTKSKVLEVGKKRQKIGVIGYLTPETATLSNPGPDVKFYQEIPAIREEARRLKYSEGVKIIIALGHSGFELDKQIAQQVEEVDVVVGGHSNTFLYSGKPPDVERPAGPYPFCVVQPSTQRKVPVVQAYHVTKYLGQLWVDFDENGEVLRSFGNPILMDSSIPQDYDLLQKVHAFQNKFDLQTKQIIGQTEVFLEGYGESCRFRECNLGVFITDSFIDYNIRHNKSHFDEKLYWTDAPIALQQSGGIRNNIDDHVNEGNITYFQLMSAIPFTNKIGKVNMKGINIQKALDNAFRNYDGKTPRGEFLQVSGLDIEVDFSRPREHRVASIKARSPKINEKHVYYDLDPEMTYWVLMSEYMWEGGDGFVFDKKDSTFLNFGISDFDIVKEQLEINSPIAPDVKGRIKLINAERLNEFYNPVTKSIDEPKIYQAVPCGSSIDN